MPTAKKLPSGSWRCQVFAGYELTADGRKKRLYESFTAPTKKEAERLAADWNCERNIRPSNITVNAAVKKYIDAKRPVLSPSTIRGYIVCSKRFQMIGDLKLSDLRTSTVQPWISDMSLDLSRKSIQNTYGLLTAVMDYHGVNTGNIKIRFPARQKNEYELPSDEDIDALLKHTTGTRLWTAIMLARYYSLRRSEICALKRADLRGNELTVHRACVMDEDANYVIKETPKTYWSHRKLTIDEPLLSVLKEGLFVDYNPGILSDRFRAAQKEAGIRPFNFHLLRHVFATKAAMLGIPDFYIAKIGGWEPNSAVLKSIYQNVQKKDLQDKMKELNEAMQHEMQHEMKKPAK